MFVEAGVILVCLLVNAFLVVVEIAFVAVSKASLRQLIRQGHGRAGALLRLREHPERTLSVIQIGITLAAALAGVVGGTGAKEDISPLIREGLTIGENTADLIAIVLVALPLTYFTVVISELVPKSLALRNPLSLALMAVPWLILLESILHPVVSMLTWSTRRFLSLFRVLTRRTSVDTKVVESADATVELDLLSTQHREYVMNLVELERKRIKDVYLQWDSVIVLDLAMSIQEVEATVIGSGHTRLPVTAGTTVKGILNTKEFAALRASGREDWPALIRPAVELQVEMPLLKALRLLQERRMHLGIVYAGPARLGIATLEDILEEVVGEIYDEDDEGTLPRLLASGAKRVSGSAPPLPKS
jgi:putative hemolysin